MKKTVFTLIAACLLTTVSAQIDSTQQYFKSPYIPSFNIRKVPDSSSFTEKMLKKDKATILMFFDPDCDHCQHATKDFTTRIDRFKDVQILMVTIMDFGRTKKFYKDYKIADFPNITVTRDGVYDLPKFYKVHSIPDVYIYDKSGKLIKHYLKDIPVDEIAGLF
ncbi:MAG: redoxin domain-containing protein [Ferruginibacter sp.]|nr:redoxin domain-containing protein [Ferruginibacter sp.]